MPVFTDSLLLGEVVRRVGEAMRDRVLIAPLMWLGNSHHHMGFPGTLSASPRVYLDLLNDLAENLIAHGFRRIAFINGHGGNITLGKQAIFAIRQRHRDRTDLLLLFGSYWDHEPAYRGWTTKDRTASGHIGHPQDATADKGEYLFATTLVQIDMHCSQRGAARRLRPQVDDGAAHVKSGGHLCAALRSAPGRRTALSVLFTSGVASGQPVSRSLADLETDFLAKPVSVDALTGKVRSLLA
jgi:hypothetical protein